MTLRVIGADDGQRLLLIEPGDRLPLEPPGVAVLLERGVVQLALPLQPLVEQTVLRPGRAQLLAVCQDHSATLRNEARTRPAVVPIINPK